MKIQIGKWGNSLAVRLPKEIVERLQLREGDTIDAQAIESALVHASRVADKERRRLALEEIRRRRTPLPADWKFDRDEANWRPAFDKW